MLIHNIDFFETKLLILFYPGLSIASGPALSLGCELTRRSSSLRTGNGRNTPKNKQLSNHVLKVLRADLKDVVLFIIDEVSMVSSLTLIYIHLRLCEIFDTNDCDDGWFGQ